MVVLAVTGLTAGCGSAGAPQASSSPDTGSVTTVSVAPSGDAFITGETTMSAAGDESSSKIAPGATVLSVADAHVWELGKSDSRGLFKIAVRPGDYVLEANCGGGGFDVPVSVTEGATVSVHLVCFQAAAVVPS